MKNTHRIHITASLVVLLLGVLATANAFAAVDYYLKIDDKHGKSQIVRCPDGSCSVDNLVPGDYTASVVDANGKAWLPGNFKIELGLVCRKAGKDQQEYLAAPLDAQSGQASGKQAATTTGSVTSPRDAASGLPTGKRMHKPLTITKELDKTTPLLSFTAPANDSGAGAGDAGTAIVWTLTIRVQRIEMK